MDISQQKTREIQIGGDNMFILYYKGIDQITEKYEHKDFDHLFDIYTEHIRAGFKTRIYDDKGNLLVGREDKW